MKSEVVINYSSIYVASQLQHIKADINSIQIIIANSLTLNFVRRSSSGSKYSAPLFDNNSSTTELILTGDNPDSSTCNSCSLQIQMTFSNCSTSITVTSQLVTQLQPIAVDQKSFAYRSQDQCIANYIQLASWLYSYVVICSQFHCQLSFVRTDLPIPYQVKLFCKQS